MRRQRKRRLSLAKSAFNFKLTFLKNDAFRYRVNRRIGQGSFGEVYTATELTTGLEVAIKLEPVRVRCFFLYLNALKSPFSGESSSIGV